MHKTSLETTPPPAPEEERRSESPQPVPRMPYNIQGARSQSSPSPPIKGRSVKRPMQRGSNSKMLFAFLVIISLLCIAGYFVYIYQKKIIQDMELARHSEEDIKDARQKEENKEKEKEKTEMERFLHLEQLHYFFLEGKELVPYDGKPERKGKAIKPEKDAAFDFILPIINNKFIVFQKIGMYFYIYNEDFSKAGNKIGYKAAGFMEEKGREVKEISHVTTLGENSEYVAIEFKKGDYIYIYDIKQMRTVHKIRDENHDKKSGLKIGCMLGVKNTLIIGYKLRKKGGHPSKGTLKSYHLSMAKGQLTINPGKSKKAQPDGVIHLSKISNDKILAFTPNQINTLSIYEVTTNAIKGITQNSIKKEAIERGNQALKLQNGKIVISTTQGELLFLEEKGNNYHYKDTKLLNGDKSSVLQLFETDPGKILVLTSQGNLYSLDLTPQAQGSHIRQKFQKTQFTDQSISKIICYCEGLANSKMNILNCKQVNIQYSIIQS